MSSTGEVGCISEDFDEALLSSMIAVDNTIPQKNIMVSSGGVKSKVDLLEPCKLLDKTDTTCMLLQEQPASFAITE